MLRINILFIIGIFALLSFNANAHNLEQNLFHSKVARSDFLQKIYLFGTVARVSWFSANNYCRLNDMQLVNIMSNEENDFIEQQIVQLGYLMEAFWLSGNDLAENRSFVWGNGRPFVYQNFGFLDDDVVGSHCVAKVQEDADERYFWNIYTCSTEHFFLCERSTVDNCNPVGPTQPPTSPQTTTSTPPVIGPPTSTTFPPIVGINYVLINLNATFQEAYDYCANSNMSLASIFSTFENDRLNNAIMESTPLIFDENTFFWTSLNDLYEEGNFVWIQFPDEIIPFNNWGVGQPSIGTDQRCAGVGNTTLDGHIVWQNRNCYDSHPFACEFF